MLDVARVIFAQREYRSAAPVIDSATQTKHPLAVEIEYNTLLRSESDATTFGTYILGLFKLDRWNWSCFLNKENPLVPTLEVGQTVTVVYPRFGFDLGANFIVKRIKTSANALYDELTLFGPESIVVGADVTPDAFGFTDQSNVPVSTVITSNSVTPTGFDTATSISITGGEYEINGSGTWLTSSGTFSPGQSVKVRHTSSGSLNTATNTTLTIGGVSDTFTSTTVATSITNDRVTFFGDSITVAGGGFVDMFDSAYPAFDVLRNAVGGTAINTGSNSFMSRQAAVIANNSEVVVILAGANDLSNTAAYPTVASWFTALYNLTDPIRAAGQKVVLGVTLPQGEGTGPPPVGDGYPGAPANNARLAAVKAQMIADIGIKNDGVFDYDGTAFANVANADSVTYMADKLHPTVPAGHAEIHKKSRPEIYYAAGYTNEVDQFTFTDVGSATLSTVYTSNTITITGISRAESKSYSISGSGFTVSKNGGSFTTSPGTVVFGDTLTVRGTSSSSSNVSLTGTLTVGTVSDGFTISTTSALVTTYISGATGNGAFGSGFTFTGLTTTSSKKHIIAVMSSNAGVPTAVSLDGNAATMWASVSTSGKTVSFWAVDITTGGTGKNLVITRSGIWAVGYAMWTTDTTATFDSSQSLAYAYPNDPIRTPSVTLPAGGSILVGLHSESTTASITPEAGTTERFEAFDPGNWKFWAGERASTGQPGVTGLAFAGSQMLAIAIKP